MNRDPLDDILDAAESPAASDAVERLARTYSRRRRAVRITRTAGTVLATAAVLSLAIVARRWDGRNGPSLPTVAIQLPPTSQPARPEPALVRPPTLAERIALRQAVGERSARRAAATRQASKPFPLPTANAEPAVTSSQWAALRAPQAEIRLAAARTIGRAADDAAVRTLIEMSSEPRDRREAVAALVACPRPDAQAFLRSERARALTAIARTFAGTRSFPGMTPASTRSGA